MENHWNFLWRHTLQQSSLSYSNVNLICCNFSLEFDLHIIDFLKHSLPRSKWSCNRGEGRVFGGGQWSGARPSKTKGAARVLFCHTVGYLPCRYRNVGVNIAVTSAIVCLIHWLFGYYFARLPIKAAGISAAWLSSHGPFPFTETHWWVQRRHSRCQTHGHSSQYSFSSSFYNFIHDLELMACHAKSKLL